MKNKIKQTWLLTLLLLVSMFTACKKEKDPVINNSTVTSSIFGRVVDENGNGVYGATAIAGGKTTTSDVNGIFRINNASLDKNHAFVKITKAGFFDGSRTFIASAGNINNVEIRLLTKTLKGTFSAVSGATITVTADATVTFPANAIKKADGTIYTGTVNVYAAYLDPTDANLSTKMPGNLLGVRTDNSESVLQSFGMLNVELEDASGNKLNIADGKEATISATVPASLLATAPVTIPLWHFDMSTGLWKEEGGATLTAGKYIGNVKHFSWWNLDKPYIPIKIKFRVVDANGNPIPFLHTHLSLIPGGGGFYPDTDNNGVVETVVPQNYAFNITGIDACFNYYSIGNYGPFTVDTDLGDIVFNAPSIPQATYTGIIINCSNGIVSNGYVKFRNGAQDYFVPADANGNFLFNFLNCSNATTFTLTAYDMDGLQQGLSQTVTFSTGTVNLGNVSSCGAAIDEYIQYQVDGGNMIRVESVGFEYGSPMMVYGTDIAGDYMLNFNCATITGTGSFQLVNGLQIFISPNNYYTTNFSGLTHVVTNYPAIGGYIEGTLNGSFVDDATSVSHTVNCSYRIKRTQ
jgi:hypothetical protein